MRILAMVCLTLGLSACASFGQKDVSDEQSLYKDARAALDKGNYTSALAQYNVLEDRYPFGDYARQVQLDKMYAKLHGVNPEDVILDAGRFIRLNPEHKDIDYAYYLRALARYQIIKKGTFLTPEAGEKSLKPVQDAFTSFNNLVTLYPESQYADQARGYLLELRGQIALHHLSVGQFYLAKRAYLAAINRADVVLYELPGSIHTQAALQLAIDAYQALGDDIKVAEYQGYLAKLASN